MTHSDLLLKNTFTDISFFCQGGLPCVTLPFSELNQTQMQTSSQQELLCLSQN